MEPLIGNWCGLSPIYKPPDSNNVSPVDGHLSFQRNVLCGVPHGTIPLLFLIYVNDLPNCLEFTTPYLHADDSQIFASSIEADVLANNINSDLENLCDWLTVNRLQFYPLKTKLMLIGSPYFDILLK